MKTLLAAAVTACCLLGGVAPASAHWHRHYRCHWHHHHRYCHRY